MSVYKDRNGNIYYGSSSAEYIDYSQYRYRYSNTADYISYTTDPPRNSGYTWVIMDEYNKFEKEVKKNEHHLEDDLFEI